MLFPFTFSVDLQIQADSREEAAAIAREYLEDFELPDMEAEHPEVVTNGWYVSNSEVLHCEE